MPPIPKLALPKTTANGMLVVNTPVQDYRKEYGLWVKREDRACPYPGPPFSKTRGVYARVKSRPEEVIGVLDTYHSQAGWAVARACQVLGKQCINFYPKYKADEGQPPRRPQEEAFRLGAFLFPLPAGRSCILYHAAKKEVEKIEGYMMPNALKLEESVEETAKEVDRVRGSYPFLRNPGVVVLPVSSGTIAAGVVRGFGPAPKYILHMGYSRSPEALKRYVLEASGVPLASLSVVDEGYAYKDHADPKGIRPPWPCNAYYDLKAFQWWIRYGRQEYREALFWNIG